MLDLAPLAASPLPEAQLLSQLALEHRVPPAARFSLLLRLRAARHSADVAWRQHSTALRMRALWMLTMRENSKSSARWKGQGLRAKGGGAAGFGLRVTPR